MSSEENKIGRKIKEWMDMRVHHIFRFHVGRTRGYYRTGKKSVGDWVGLHGRNGHFICIETKVPGKQPTSEQLCFIDLVNRCGGIGIVANSLEDIIRDGRL